MATRDKSLVDKICQELMRGGQSNLEAYFRNHQSRPPDFIWSPVRDDFISPLVAKFFTQIDAKRTGSNWLTVDSFDLEDFAAMHDWITVFDVEEDGDSFRYTFFGDGIAAIRGRSLIGETTEAISNHVSLFFYALQKAVMNRGEAVLSRHDPPKEIFARRWERLTVPVHDANGKIVQIVAIAVPDNELRPGLEIIPDPVLIIDANRIVRFANRSAREMFGRMIYQGGNLDLFDFAGIDATMPAAPEDLANTGQVHDMVSIALRDRMVERFHLTISGVMLWDHGFYVLTLRPVMDPPQ